MKETSLQNNFSCIVFEGGGFLIVKIERTQGQLGTD